MTVADEIRRALQLIQSGQWQAAHELVQSRRDAAACRVHALLHRIEGDDGNAGFWYRQANQPFPDVDTDTELRDLLNEFGGD